MFWCGAQDSAMLLLVYWFKEFFNIYLSTLINMVIFGLLKIIVSNLYYYFFIFYTNIPFSHHPYLSLSYQTGRGGGGKIY